MLNGRTELHIFDRGSLIGDRYCEESAYSPDLNPIEHVWDALGRRIAARLLHSEDTQQLKQMPIEDWVLQPQEMLHQLVLSMRTWSARVISNTAPYHNTRCRTSVVVHSAAVQHPLSTVSTDSNPTIVVLQTDASLVSKDNFIPFCHPHPSFIAPLAAETSVAPRQG
ncbi:transposable element Tcb2 transposase [Trichonephila clavipes]|nr:transposable element Tcb2 transposase [Trichonephila clavipes]